MLELDMRLHARAVLLRGCPEIVRILGIDPSDPEADGGITGAAALDGFTPIAIGHLERGRECDEMLEWIERHGITDVAVEVAREVYLDGAHLGTGARISITRTLLRQNLLAGALLDRARVRLGTGHVHAVEAPVWRRALAVRRSRQETMDAAVARALRLRVPSWPMVSNAHERDAGGVALGISISPMAMAKPAIPILRISASSSNGGGSYRKGGRSSDIRPRRPIS